MVVVAACTVTAGHEYHFEMKRHRRRPDERPEDPALRRESPDPEETP
jgi:hypothetical protein